MSELLLFVEDKADAGVARVVKVRGGQVKHRSDLVFQDTAIQVSVGNVLPCFHGGLLQGEGIGFDDSQESNHQSLQKLFQFVLLAVKRTWGKYLMTVINN